MVLINETSRIEAYAGPPARSRVATDPSEMSLRTHFQPDITIVDVGGVVDACNAERLSDYVADLASPGRPLILDLYCVNFFGSEGLRAFARIAEACQHKGVRWAVGDLAKRSTDCCISPTAPTDFPPRPRWRRPYSSWHHITVHGRYRSASRHPRAPDA